MVREDELLGSPRSEASDAELRVIELAKRRAVRDAESQDREALEFDPLLVSAGENEHAMRRPFARPRLCVAQGREGFTASKSRSVTTCQLLYHLRVLYRPDFPSGLIL